MNCIVRWSRPEKYTTIEHFKSLGFDVVTCPWDDLAAIPAQGEYAQKDRLFGLLETVWHHFQGNRFGKMMAESACAAWGAEWRDRDVWNLPAAHWRQMGWDMGVDSRDETGFVHKQVTHDIGNY